MYIVFVFIVEISQYIFEGLYSLNVFDIILQLHQAVHVHILASALNQSTNFLIIVMLICVRRDMPTLYSTVPL